jgi:hypothetical protein
LDDGNTVVWFDMAENYITKDGSNRVGQWSDRSGNDNHLLQAGADGIKPVWSSDGLLFDGTNDFMACNVFTLEQPEQIYIVFKQVTWSTTFVFDGHAINSGRIAGATGTPNLQLNAGVNDINNNNLAVNTWGIGRVLFNGLSSSFQIDETSAATGNAGTNDMNGFHLGSRGGGTGGYSNIQVKEIVIRKIADSAPDNVLIYTYLKNKYNL